jgi:2-methylcitrate dehydratase PrpD
MSPATTRSDPPAATAQLARHVAGLRYEELPPSLVGMLKQCVLDTLGVAIAASSLADEAKPLHEYVREQGGAGQASLLGFGGRAPAALAVFLNASLGHMVDYDDVGAGGHVSIATVPVALALAERGRPVSGRALLAALAAGTDVHTRLNMAIRLPDWTIAEGWFPTQLFGYLSGTAAAASLLRLDAAQVENAFGIAFSQMAGSRQMAVGSATHLRSMQAGFSGQAALLAADLTSRGIVGSRSVIEGRYGLFRTYVRTEPDWDALLGGLGTEFPLLALHGFKIWPACGYTRAPNAALQSLRTRHAIAPDDVRRVTIIGGTGGTRLLCEPIEAKRRPRLGIDAKFSIPYTCAVMLQKGNVTLADYTDEALHDPAVLALADRFTYREDPGSTLPVGGYSSLARPVVEIEMNDGRVFREQAAGMPGDPAHPVTQDVLEAKFRDCVAFAARPIAKANAERAIECVRDLDAMEDVAAIVELLAGGR